MILALRILIPLLLGVSAAAHGTICHAHNDQTTGVSGALTPALPSGARWHAYQFTPIRNIFPQVAWIYTASPMRDDYMRLELWSDAGGIPGNRILEGTTASPRSASAKWLGVNFNSFTQLSRGTAYWLVWVEAGESIVPEEPGGSALPRATRDASGTWTTSGSGAAKFRLFCGDTIEGPGVLRSGSPCSTSLDAQPIAWSNETPNVGNVGFAIECVHLPPATSAWLLIGFDPQFLTVRLDQLLGAPFGCNLYTAVAATFAGTAGAADIGDLPASPRPAPAGHVRFPVPVPNDAAIAATVITAQVLAVDRGASSPLPVVSSNGLIVTIY